MKKLILKVTMALFGVLLFSAPMTTYATTETCTLDQDAVGAIIEQMCSNQSCGEKLNFQSCVKPDDKPVVKPDDKPVVKPDDKPVVKPEDKPENGNPNLDTYEAKVGELVNLKRVAAGLEPLAININLSNVAEKKGEDMRDNNYFSHTSPTYGSPFDMMKTFGIKYMAAGENIAKGQRTPEAVMAGWMNSEGHRANIMNSNFTEIGIGCVTDSNGATYWVQMFIRP